MDPRLVWDMWRRILTDDRLVEWVVNPGGRGDLPVELSPDERAILDDYARTPVATDTNIGMYRRGLVRNALAALSFVPLTRHLLCMTDLDIEEVAEDFTRSTGYRDFGPHFWEAAGAFVAYLADQPDFAAPAQQDVFQLDLATVELARRLGAAVATGDNQDLSAPSTAPVRAGHGRVRASRAVMVVATGHALSDWIENPDSFDPEEALALGPGYTLVYFPADGGRHGYVQLSEAAAAIFTQLAQPCTVAEVSRRLDGMAESRIAAVIDSLRPLGVIVDVPHPLEAVAGSGGAGGVASRVHPARKVAHVSR